jgi:DNA-directed RNA polymerase specialized sigma24 family protein
MTGPSIDELVRRYGAGESCATIAARSGLRPSTVLWRLKRAGVKLRPPGRPSIRGLPGVADADLVTRYKAGETCAEIAAATGLPGSTVHIRLKRAGDEMRRPDKALGYRRHALPDAEIVKRYTAGESITAIAQSLGVPASAVRVRLIEAGVQRRRRGRPHSTLMEPVE